MCADLLGAQQGGPLQQQAEFGVSLRGGGAADGGGEGEEQQEEARGGGHHLLHLSVCLRRVCWLRPARGALIEALTSRTTVGGVTDDDDASSSLV